MKVLRKLILSSLVLISFSPISRAAPEAVQGGWFEADLPMPVLHLEGSIEDVARAHGVIIGRHLERRQTLRYLSSVVRHRLDDSARLQGRPVARAILDWAYRRLIRGPMVDHLPDRYRAAYAEFARSAGMREDEIWDAVVLPDAALRGVSLLYDSELGPILPANFGCTSVIWNSGSVSVLHGRNLDYDGVGTWDRHPVIMHVVPPEGLAYVAISALGVHAPGITAFNEAGLTLAVHQLTFDDTQASGTPLAVISAEVIRNARTIDDAIAIIRGFPRAGGWGYVLSQGRDRAVVESSANEIAIRRSSEPFFFQTNHVASPALASRQIFYSPGSWLDSFERSEKLAKFSRTSEARGWATPEKMGALLADADESRVAGGTIGKLDNIQSVVMDASHRRLWVAVGTDQLAPNENKYVEYRWSDLRSPAAPEVTGAEFEARPNDKRDATLRALLRKAAELRGHSSNVPSSGEQRAKLLENYARRVEENSKNGSPPAGTWAGLLLHAFEATRTGSTPPEQILKRLELALRDADFEKTEGPSAAAQAARHRLSVARLYRGRVLDLAGRRSEALFDYEVVRRQAPFSRVSEAAARGLRRPFDAEQARLTAIDWAGIDLFQY